MGLTISVIVPAYNEEKRIRNVLAMLATTSVADEVICVNDGSTDGTKEIVETFPSIRLIDLPKNGGKANAIVEGISAAKGDVVLFIDADLAGLTDQALQLLAEPLLSGRYDVAIGYPSKIEDVTLFRPLTGERGYFRRDLLPHLDEFRDKGYGLELTLNYLFRNKRIKIVVLRGVTQLYKESKYPLGTALKREIDAWKEMLRVVSKHKHPVRFTYQAYIKNFYIKPRRAGRRQRERVTETR